MQQILNWISANYGNALNFAVCGGVLISGIVLYVKLRRTKNTNETGLGFIPNSYLCWLASWFFWCLLWVFETINLVSPTISTFLSDLNTLSLVLFYFSFTRGKDYQKKDFGKYLLSAGAIIFSSIGILYLIALGSNFSNINQKLVLGFSLHLKLSIALSILSPLLVGWSFRLRHDSFLVFFIGLVYATAQPIAYYLVLENKGENAFTQEFKEIFLVILAFLKIIWATAVTYFIGRKPRTSDSLVDIPKKSEIHNFYPNQLIIPLKIRRNIRDKKQTPPYDYFYSKLSNESIETKELIDTSESKFSAEQIVLIKSAITKMLNEVLGDSSFYNDQRFKDISLSQQSEHLILENDKGKDIRTDELNRSLLEDIFKDEIDTSFYLISNWKKSVSKLIIGFGILGLCVVLLVILRNTDLESLSLPQFITIAGSLLSVLAGIISLLGARINYKTAGLKSRER